MGVVDMAVAEMADALWRAERERAASLADDKAAQKVLFGQRARQ